MGALADYKYNEKISPANERAALQVLREGCFTALARYPETEEEDMKLMENSRLFASLPKNARMAVKLRRNEKRILLRTIRTTEVALDALMGQSVEAMEGGGLQRGPQPKFF